MKAPSITINNNTSTKKKQTANQSTSTVDQMKTTAYSLNEHVQTQSETSLFYQNQKKNMNSFLQEKDLALQPLDFIYQLTIIPNNTRNELRNENDDDLFKEELLNINSNLTNRNVCHSLMNSDNECKNNINQEFMLLINKNKLFLFMEIHNHNIHAELTIAYTLINQLKHENKLLKEKLTEQINMYKKLAKDFSAQQILLEEKTMKITTLIDKVNLLVEKINKAQIKEIEYEGIITKNKIINENECKRNLILDNKCELIKNYQKNIEKLKVDNKLLTQENDSLCKENVEMQRTIAKMKYLDTNQEYHYRNCNNENTNKFTSLNYKSKNYKKNSLL